MMADFVANADHTARIKEIRAAETPKCEYSGMTLYACLRSPARCREGCERRGDWIGPDVK